MQYFYFQKNLRTSYATALLHAHLNSSQQEGDNKHTHFTVSFGCLPTDGLLLCYDDSSSAPVSWGKITESHRHFDRYFSLSTRSIQMLQLFPPEKKQHFFIHCWHHHVRHETSNLSQGISSRVWKGKTMWQCYLTGVRCVCEYCQDIYSTAG